MLLTWALQIFKNFYSVSLSSLAPSHPNFNSSKTSLSTTSSEPWYSLWTRSAIFSGKYSIAQMLLPVTSQPQSWRGWLLNYCSICTFHQVSSSICLLGVQQKTVSIRWQQERIDILFLSFIFLSKLLEPRSVDVFSITTIQATSIFFF